MDSPYFYPHKNVGSWWTFLDSRRAEHCWSSSKYSLGKIQSEVLESFKKYEKEDGVLGVECSNHSVPTIFFNDLAQSAKVGLFHV